MSVGCFIGIKASYIDEAQNSADEFIRAINNYLQENGFTAYKEPEIRPDIYNNHSFGRSELDHHSAKCFLYLAEIAKEKKIITPNLSLVAENPFRVVFIPRDIESPFQSDYEEEIFGKRERIWVGSATQLLKELLELAPSIGIPLKNNSITDETAERINNFEPLFENDSGELAEDERTAWLLLFEGANLAVKHDVALSLAG